MTREDRERLIEELRKLRTVQDRLAAIDREETSIDDPEIRSELVGLKRKQECVEMRLQGLKSELGCSDDEYEKLRQDYEEGMPSGIVP